MPLLIKPPCTWSELPSFAVFGWPVNYLVCLLFRNPRKKKKRRTNKFEIVRGWIRLPMDRIRIVPLKRFWKKWRIIYGVNYFVSLVCTASRIFVVLVIVVSFSRLYPLPRTNFPEMNCRVNFDHSPALVSVAKKKRTRAVRNRASSIHLRS